MPKTNGRAHGGIGVGSRVVYHMPWGTMNAVVVEDRGKNGYKGRRLMSIRPLLEAVDDAEPFEVPLERLTLAE
ncbi:MAG: hypothetical protein JO306_05765 [Gemmatimonadetes bacterium]|nr:hypothetical protein [Gemmatimonadota bacterium]